MSWPEAFLGSCLLVCVTLGVVVWLVLRSLGHDRSGR